MWRRVQWREVWGESEMWYELQFTRGVYWRFVHLVFTRLRIVHFTPVLISLTAAAEQKLRRARFEMLRAMNFVRFWLQKNRKDPNCSTNLYKNFQFEKVDMRCKWFRLASYGLISGALYLNLTIWYPQMVVCVRRAMLDVLATFSALKACTG